MEHDPVWIEFKESELQIFLKMYHEEEEKAIEEIRQNYDIRIYQIEKILKSRRKESS
jgi:hypothetical protein